MSNVPILGKKDVHGARALMGPKRLKQAGRNRTIKPSGLIAQPALEWHPRDAFFRERCLISGVYRDFGEGSS